MNRKYKERGLKYLPARVGDLEVWISIQRKEDVFLTFNEKASYVILIPEMEEVYIRSGKFILECFSTWNDKNVIK